MRLKAVIKYHLSELKNSLLIFYGIIAAVLALLSLSYISMSRNSINGSVGGVEMASVIFLFVVGLNSFKQNYLFLSSNGITRRTQFVGFMMSAAPVTVIMAVIDTVIANVLSEFINYNSMFDQIYSGHGLMFTCFIWSIALYMSSVTLGYFITILYYRMSKLLKVSVSVGVPVLFFVVIPILDAVLFNGRVSAGIFDLFLLLGGLKDGVNPWISVITLIAEAAVFTGLAFILSRRSVIKE